MGIRKLVFLDLDTVALGCLALAVLALARGNFNCPYCRSIKVRYSHPTPVEKLLCLIYLRPYRCRACRKRFYARQRWRALTS